MSSRLFLLLMIAGLFVAGIGFGLFTGWVTDPEPGSIWFPVIGGLIFIGGMSVLVYGFRSKVNDRGDVSDLDMFLGDMSDPVQRGIILRVAIAGAIHGILLMRFLNFEATVLVPGDGALTRGEWLTIASYGAFALTLIWIVIECIIFHNIDEFWRRVAMGPTALAGVILFIAVVLYTLAEDFLGAPQARFWWYYALFYFSGLFLIIGKWKLDKARG